jgi:stage IV sporulation protein B
MNTVKKTNRKTGKITKTLLKIALPLILALTLTVPALAMDSLPPLIPVGSTVGLQVRSDGAMIIGLNGTERSERSPAADAGLKSGDVIIYVGSQRVGSVEETQRLVSESNGQPISIRVSRAGKELQFQVTPSLKADGSCEMGVWLRDAIAGIGTITFVEPNSGVFGALGHSIADGDTGTLVPLLNGKIMTATVTDVVKGEDGKPGQLQGSFDALDPLGTLTQNTENGVFGVANSVQQLAPNAAAIPAASRSEIHVGAAVIRSSVGDGGVEEYAIEISKVFPAGGERDMLITVTDPKLIARTGGIIQGMSGSPIIQDGKLVGAVTHVLVSDPKRGYAISIERMLEEVRRRESTKQ